MKNHLQITLCLFAFIAMPRIAHAQEQKKDSAYLLNTFVFGVSLGTPGGINLIGGYYWKQIGIRIEIGGIIVPPSIGWAGYSASLSYILIRGKNWFWEISSFGMRLIDLDGNSRFSLGGSSSVNVGGFFVELGLTAGSTGGFHWGDNLLSGNLIPLIQIGYVY